MTENQRHDIHLIENAGTRPIKVTVTPVSLDVADGSEYTATGMGTSETIPPKHTSKRLHTESSQWYEVKCTVPGETILYAFDGAFFDHGRSGPFGANRAFVFRFLVAATDHRTHVGGTFHFPP